MSDAEAWKPGQDTQAVATARLQGQDPDKIHCPAWGVIGNLGDSICYAGVPAKVKKELSGSSQRWLEVAADEYQARRRLFLSSSTVQTTD